MAQYEHGAYFLAERYEGYQLNKLQINIFVSIVILSPGVEK